MKRFIERLERSLKKRLPDFLVELIWGKGSDPESPDAINPADITWYAAPDAGSWPITAKLDASVDSRYVHLRYDKANVWPVGQTKASDGGPLVGNCWVIVKINGTWHAGPFDWMRPGQQLKEKHAVAGGTHLPYRPFAGWTPTPGETYGFMTSTFARGPERTLNERSNITEATWR